MDVGTHLNILFEYLLTSANFKYKSGVKYTPAIYIYHVGKYKRLKNLQLHGYVKSTSKYEMAKHAKIVC